MKTCTPIGKNMELRFLSVAAPTHLEYFECRFCLHQFRANAKGKITEVYHCKGIEMIRLGYICWQGIVSIHNRNSKQGSMELTIEGESEECQTQTSKPLTMDSFR